MTADKANADSGQDDPGKKEQVATGEQQEAQHGIRDGYYDPGRYNSPNRSTAVDFAYAPEVAEDIGSNDAREIAIAVADSEVEAMANQIAAMPDEVKAHFGLADFKGLGWKAVEQKLEEANAASPDLFDGMAQCYQNAMRAAEYRIDHISGTVVNGYIQHNGTGAYAHGNMEGVQCITQENNTSVARFAWPQITDEDMMMKIQYDEQGNVIGGCTQVIILAGTDKAIIVMDGVPSITELPPGPTPDTGDDTNDDTDDGTHDDTNDDTHDDTNDDTDDDTHDDTNDDTNDDTHDDTNDDTDDEIKPKDPDNLTRIDQNINDDISENIGGSEVVNHTDLGTGEQTQQPSASEFGDTEASTTPNSTAQPTDTAQQPTPVQENISQANDGSQDRGDANPGYRPVVADESGQQAANNAEQSISDAPSNDGSSNFDQEMARFNR